MRRAGASRRSRSGWTGYMVGLRRRGKTDEDREAYLLGKKRIDKLVEVGKAVDELSPLNAFSSNDALIYGANANTARDIANKIREDPLLAIKRREQASLQAVINNPVRLKALKEANSAAGGKDTKKKDKKSKMAKKEEKSNRNRREEEEIDRAGKRKHHGGSAEESVGRGSPKRRMRSPPSSSDDSQSDRGESSSTRRALRDNNRRVEPNRERGYKEDWRRAGRREDLDSERHASRDNDHRDDTSRHYRDDVQDKRRYPERSYADRRAVDDRRDDNGDLYGSQRRPREQTGRDKDRCLDNAPASRESERSWDERSRCGHGVNRDQASQNSGDSAAPIKGVMDESKRIKLEAMLANAK